jgi:hypothetical protein
VAACAGADSGNVAAIETDGSGGSVAPCERPPPPRATNNNSNVAVPMLAATQESHRDGGRTGAAIEAPGPMEMLYSSDRGAGARGATGVGSVAPAPVLEGSDRHAASISLVNTVVGI